MPRRDDEGRRGSCGGGEELAKPSLYHNEFFERVFDRGNVQDEDADVEMDVAEDSAADVSTSSVKLSRLFVETMTSVRS